MRVVRKNTLIWGLRFEYGAILKGSQTGKGVYIHE